MLATIEQTKAAALALLAPLTDDAHVQADMAETNGDSRSASLHRDEPTLPGESYREVEVDSKYVPRTLRGFSPRAISAYFFADPDPVLGLTRHKVDAGRVASEILGDSFPLWDEILDQPNRVQTALAMALIAEIRSVRAMSKVYRGIR